MHQRRGPTKLLCSNNELPKHFLPAALAFAPNSPNGNIETVHTEIIPDKALNFR